MNLDGNRMDAPEVRAFDKFVKIHLKALLMMFADEAQRSNVGYAEGMTVISTQIAETTNNVMKLLQKISPGNEGSVAGIITSIVLSGPTATKDEIKDGLHQPNVIYK